MTHLMSYVLNKKRYLTLIVFIITLVLISADFSCALEYANVGNPDSTPPTITAKSAILYSIDLDEVIYSKNADLKCDPYSVTKLMTAYLAAEKLDLGQEVTISKRAANDFADGSTMFLQPGEIVTVKDLLYGTLLTSGNDAAYALAETVSSSVNDFVELMNKTVAKWECNNTHFMNPSGYKAKGHYTTASDLLTIARKCLDNKIVREISFTKKYRMTETNKYKKRILKNHTVLFRKKNSGVLGGKTGFWDEGDCSVALEYCKDELRAMLIILKDTEKGRRRDAKALLNYAHEATPGFMIVDKGDEVGKVWVKHGAKTRVQTIMAGALYAYPKKQLKLRIHTKKIFNDNIIAPLKKGTVVGKMEIYVQGDKAGEENILLAEDVKLGWFPSNIYISNMVTVFIILIFVLFFSLIMVLRAINKRKRKIKRTS